LVLLVNSGQGFARGVHFGFAGRGEFFHRGLVRPGFAVHPFFFRGFARPGVVFAPYPVYPPYAYYVAPP
jgi:hypothetical protein